MIRSAAAAAPARGPIAASPGVRPGTARVSQDRMSALVASVVASPVCWSNLVRFDPVRRWYRQLELTEDYELWLLSWLPGQETGFHDHGDAVGALAVADGELCERTAMAGRRRVVGNVLGAGQVRSFGRRHVHDLRNDSARPAVSVHGYAPPLAMMRRYKMAESGLVLVGTDLAGQDW
jgi:Cysteine dioxygenase type I